MSDTQNDSISHDPMRRNDIAKESLDTGMNDLYWLHNLSVDVWYHDGHDDLLDTAENLRHDAEVIEKAHGRLQEGEITGAEAAVFIAKRVKVPDRTEYDVQDWLDEEMPITEEP